MNRQIQGIYRAVLAFGLFVLSGPFNGQARADMVYNAVNDFSLASNPNGVWSYGSLSALTGGTFTADQDTIINQSYTGQEAWFNGQALPNSSIVEKNASGSTQTYATITLPTNLLRLDGQSGTADVRFIAPTAGVYSVSGLFQRIDNGGESVNVGVDLNGVALFSASFATFNAQEMFDLSNLNLAAGDVLDFVEGAPQYNNDSTGLEVTIDAVVPEPSSLFLLASGCLGVLAVAYRRSRRA
jgi:PEP-CTERM motif